MISKDSKIYIAGHRGMLGSALIRFLESEGYNNLLLRTRSDLDLKRQDAVETFFKKEKPEYVILCAAKVGGIQSNMQAPAEFLYDNIILQANVIHAAYENKVKKLCFVGSSCIYPKECAQPMSEDSLLTGPLEPTNEGYAIAKIAGIKQCQMYAKQYGMNVINVMPSNIYGPNDSFDLKCCHVLSALIRRFVDAKREGLSDVTLWGTGIAHREFIHVDDVARGIMYFMNHYDSLEIINLGTGKEISIKELATMIKEMVGFEGGILWDDSKANGMLRKCMDVSSMRALGFEPCVSLQSGVAQMIDIYKNL